MKILHTFLIVIFLLTTAQAQEIEAPLGSEGASEVDVTLSGNTSSEGFTVKDDGGNTLFRVRGDGKVGIRTTSPTNTLDVAGPMVIGAGYSGTAFASGNGLSVQGNVGIGTDQPNGTLDIESSNSFQTNLFINNTGTGDPVIKFQINGGSKFTMGVDNSDDDIFQINNGTGLGVSPLLKIKADGVITGIFGTYHSASDRRLKKEIVNIPDALAKVMKLRGVNYKWKDPESEQSLQMGFIAQEVERVVPEVVHTSDDEMQIKAVEYQYLVGLLVEAMKEQQKQIEALERRISTLSLK